MKSFMKARTNACMLAGALAAFVLFSIAASGAEPAIPVPPGEGIAQGLFALDEMDMHLHAGMERPVPMAEWIDLAVADGRKVLFVLDHRELYDKSPEDYAAWLKDRGFPQWYPAGRENKAALMEDLKRVTERRDVIAFRGWEISEDELDAALESEAMSMAEVVGFHMSPNSDTPPCGATLIKRVRQVVTAQKEWPIPMIVFHPFTMRVERIQKDARKAGKDVSQLTAADYRFFQPGEQEEVAELLAGKSVYIEIAHATANCWKDPSIRAAFIADIKPLAEAGVQFTVSTDNHGLASAKTHFEPAAYCEDLGVTPYNTNTIVRELLALRARRGVSAASQQP